MTQPDNLVPDRLEALCHPPVSEYKHSGCVKRTQGLCHTGVAMCPWTEVYRATNNQCWPHTHTAPAQLGTNQSA